VFGQGGRRSRHLRPHDGQVVVALERRRAAEHLERRAGQGVLVDPAVDGAAFDLFGGHVGRGAEELPHRGQAGHRHRALAQPEVGQVHVVLLAVAGAGVEQHVGRLDVTMHQAVQVGGVERGRHLGDDADGPVTGQRAELVDQLAHVATLDEAHRDVQHAVALPGGEDRDDVRMVHGGRGPRLADEPLTERLVRSQHGRQQLQGHVPAQLDVAGTVNQRHATLADLLLEPVTGHLRTDRVRPRTWVVAPAHSSSPPALSPGPVPGEPRSESIRKSGRSRLNAVRRLRALLLPVRSAGKRPGRTVTCPQPAGR
jgi:hypothetical protein